MLYYRTGAGSLVGSGVVTGGATGAERRSGTGVRMGQYSTFRWGSPMAPMGASSRAHSARA